MTVADAWFLPPVLALALGLLALAPLGEQVLARGVVFIDLAVAQAAAAAALWIAGWVDHPGLLATQLAAAAGALVCAGAVAWMSSRWPGQREALIGLLYIAAACAALLGARQDPHGGERLSALLAADLLWAGWTQVALLGIAAALVWTLRRTFTANRIFYPLFAVVASLAVPALGLFVVFSLLIAPGLWRRAGLGSVAALAIAALACCAALATSWWLDLPSGACVAWGLAASGLLAPLLRRDPPHA